MLYALIGIPLMYLYMANIGGILASSFKYLYSKLCRFVPGLYSYAVYAFSFRIRCESEPADLPKKATLPSIKEDTLSYLDEEGASQSSQGKASREDSLVSGRAISRR